jgi:DNA-binding transcriptional MerR regulator
MSANGSSVRLTIGEFAAATQLSPKALRLYEEQSILRPAMVDASNGYRYYRRDQVASGRLVRVLREMELPLAQIGQVISADRAQAALLLREYSLDGERRFARQKRAFQNALMFLGRSSAAETLEVIQRQRLPMRIATKTLLADRHSLLACLQSEGDQLVRHVQQCGTQVVGTPMCLLVDPVSDEEGRVELAVPILEAAEISGATVRVLPASNCAVWSQALDVEALDLTAVLDALFDWLDRRGLRSSAAPAFRLSAEDQRRIAEISWDYEQV